MIKKFFMEKKSDPTASAMLLTNNHERKTRNMESYIKEGYKENVIIYRCIREIATSCMSVDIEVHTGGEVNEKHEFLKLLTKPNPAQSGPSLIEELVSDYLITGNAYLAKYPDKSKPVELWPQKPKHISVKAGDKGLPLEYIYQNGNGKKVFPVNQLNGYSELFHFKSYNPEDRFVGMSPLQPAGLSGDIHNSGLRWNNSLLEKGARPSGLINFEGTPSAEAVERLRDFFKKKVQGKNNAGEIPMLTDGATWQSMDHSPRDMDYLNTMKEVTKYIASALGVPLPLVDNDSSSFNNMEQAKERLWTDAVIPLLDALLDSMSCWLQQWYGEDFKLVANLDSIPAIENIRFKKFERMSLMVEKGILTVNEAREQLGMKPIQGGDDLYVNSSQIPLSEAGLGTDFDEAAGSLKKLGLSDKEIEDQTGKANG